MTDASTSENLSPELMKVVERAQREPEGRFHSLAHLIDVPALMRAYQRIRKDGAVGVDVPDVNYIHPVTSITSPHCCRG
jgi:hypothetical protein